ncbi:MAG TPA: barstar family protein [Phycisphaerae bacterium]|nr:barstar family protein [Phycisphaerae bacterium]
MPHKLLQLDARRITGWGTFHDLFSQLFGLPPNYPRTMNAWMNALFSLDDPAKALTSLQVSPGSMLILQLDNVDEFAEKCRPQYDAIIECIAMVNLRRLEAGAQPIVALAYFKN